MIRPQIKPGHVLVPTAVTYARQPFEEKQRLVAQLRALMQTWLETERPT